MLQNRVECQLRHPCEPRTPREWAHCICRHTPGMPPDQIAAQTAIPLKRLMKISSPMGDAHARIEEIAAVTRVTRRYDWLRAYVRAAGCELFPLPTVDPREPADDVIDQACASFRSLTDVLEALRAIARERRIQPEDRAHFDALIGAHYAHVARAEAWVDHVTTDVRLTPTKGVR